jgi:undecaprenyl-diphosphatase
MPFFSALSGHGEIWIAVALILIVQKRYRRWGIIMLVALAVTYIVGVWVIKPIVARPRPFTVTGYDLLVTAPKDYSFPSGHTTASFTAAMVICLIPGLRKGWKIGAFALAAVIAFSRMYLFVHYPTDVLGGIVLGVCGALLVVWLARKWLRSGDAGIAQPDGRSR